MGRFQIRAIVALFGANLALALAIAAFQLFNGLNVTRPANLAVSLAVAIAAFFLARGSNVARIVLLIVSLLGALLGATVAIVVGGQDGPLPAIAFATASALMAASFCGLAFSRSLRVELAMRSAQREQSHAEYIGKLENVEKARAKALR